MRVVSLLPAATEILFELGAGPEVVGVSHECNWPRAAWPLPRVTGTIVDVDAPSRSIDEQVSGALAAGKSIYTADGGLMAELRPDLVITQQLCEVCAITPMGMQKALAGVRPAPRLVSLHPHTTSEIFADVLTVGEAVGRTDEAHRYVAGLRQRLERVRVAVAGRPRVSVYCMEWLDPPYNAGHWVPEQVQIAGGREGLSVRGVDSVRLMWSQITHYDPEVLVLMPCGLSLERIEREVHGLFDENWARLRAVQNNRVFAVNGPAYFNNSGPRVVDGAELLAQILHPEVVLREFGAEDVRRIDLRPLIKA
jgi:iron complex transport system substrate-binding protein